MTNAQAGLISDFMHGSRAGRLSRRIVRIGFVVVFGAMSVFHFPVMAFGGDPHSGHSHAAEPSHHHDSDCGDAHPADIAACNGFACFLAVEPALLASRPLHAVLFGVISFDRADFRLALAAQPDLPPPRLQA